MMAVEFGVLAFLDAHAVVLLRERRGAAAGAAIGVPAALTVALADEIGLKERSENAGGRRWRKINAGGRLRRGHTERWHNIHLTVAVAFHTRPSTRLVEIGERLGILTARRHPYAALLGIEISSTSEFCVDTALTTGSLSSRGVRAHTLRSSADNGNL